MEKTRHEELLEKLGFSVIDFKSDFGTDIVAGALTTDNGNVEIDWGENGTARVYKPNGTVKWYYEKTDAQICSILKRIIDANTYKKF